jgi:hypothetical protein
MRKILFGAALLVGAFLLAVAPVRADFIIEAREGTSGAFTTIVFGASSPPGSFDGGPAAGTATIGDFTVTLTALAGTNGSQSNLLTTNLGIVNNDTTTHILQIVASINNYSLPAGNLLNMANSSGGDVTLGTTLGYSDQAFFVASNALGAMPGTATTGVQNGIFNGLSFDTGTATGTFARSGDYALTNLETYTLSGGGRAHSTDSLDVTPTPAPSSALLLLTGLPALGLAGYLRRRRAKAGS